MLYLLFKSLMRLAIWLYFGKVRREGLQHIDNGRPSLILANHTASFMDAMITAVYIKRRIWFFTRGDVFRRRWLSAVLRSLGMLPVYRMRDGKERLQENESSNEEALRILAKGGAVLIFAEGESSIEKIFKPLKKGPFRLAVRASETLPEPPFLVPLGINYVHPAAPFGDAWLVAGEPFQINAGPDVPATRVATEAMRYTAAMLESRCWHIEHPVFRPLAQFFLEEIHLLEPEPDFRQSWLLTQALNRLDYQTASALYTDWQEFNIWQRQKPRPKNLFAAAPKWTDDVITVIGLPLALIGLVLHIPPVNTARHFTGKHVKEPDFVTPVFLCLAVIFILIWYAAVGSWLLLNDHPLWMKICGILIPAGGIFYLKAWLPAMRRATGPLTRRWYKRTNPSAGLVFKLANALLNFGHTALHWEREREHV